MEQIGKSDWRAGNYLYRLLRDDQFFARYGGKSSVLLLTDGDRLISFCTFAQQDEIPDETLMPWIGFAYTFPQYRGRRYMGKLLKHAVCMAAEKGYPCVYISTDHVGLYEKYGFVYWQDMENGSGKPCRIYTMSTGYDDKKG